MGAKLSNKALLEQTVNLQAWGWHWRIVPDWRSLFEDDPGVAWLALQPGENTALLKQNALRSVWRVSLGGRVVVAKIYHPPAGWDRLKTVVIGPSGWREFLGGLYGKTQGLSTVRPVAYGRPVTGSRLGPRILLSEAITDAQPLSSFWLSKSDADGRRSRAVDNRNIADVARFLQRLHALGFAPADLHPENILIRDSGDAVLVDLHKASFNVTVNNIARCLNLADLNQWFQRRATRTDRLRFLLAYLTYAFERPSPRLIRRFATQVGEATQSTAQRLADKRDKRMFGDNEYFGVLSLPDRWTAHVYLRAKRPLAGSPCSQLQFERSQWQSALQGVVASRDSAPLDMLEVGDHRLPVTVENAAERLGAMRQRWQQAYHMINRHQTAELPLALLERRSPEGDAESILIVERGSLR